MKITVTDGQSMFINLEVDTDQLVEDVKALLEAEANIPSNRIDLYFDGVILLDNQKLNQRGVNEGAMLFFAVTQVVKKPIKGGIAEMIKQIDKKIKSVNEQGYEFKQRRLEQFKSSAKRLYEELKDDPYRLSQQSIEHPDIVEAISEGNIDKLAEIMHRKNEQKIKQLKAKQKRFIELSKDPMNVQYQKLLEERIHQENIDKNLQFANEYIPEVFGHISMLYINASINKVPIQAFVDSGAQTTVMSQSLAEKCGLMRLVDKRHEGRAVGMGSCKILGRIHAAEIQIQKKYITCSFTVIQNNSTEFLLGLDMLKRFNCIIDLKKNNLNFQDGMIVTKFLSDGQISKNKQPLNKQEMEKKVRKLIDMGFGKEESLQALKNCNYNEEAAGNMLMQRKYEK